LDNKDNGVSYEGSNWIMAKKSGKLFIKNTSSFDAEMDLITGSLSHHVVKNYPFVFSSCRKESSPCISSQNPATDLDTCCTFESNLLLHDD